MAAEDLGIDFYLNEPRPGARGQCFYSPSLKLLGEPVLREAVSPLTLGSDCTVCAGLHTSP